MTQAAPSPNSTTAEAEAIRPFRVEVREEDIDDLRRRLRATRWPEKETVGDLTQGVPLATMQELVRYWATDYDLRRFEARLNAVPQFLTEIDGLDIHFIHVRSPHADALPVIITHGWPGSIIEMLGVVGPLSDPTAHGGDAADAFDVVVPSMPGYGFSAQADGERLGPRPHRGRVDRADAAPRVHAVRRAGRRLGRADHRRDRCEGAAGAARHPLQHARHRPARRVQGPHLERLRDRPPRADRPVRRRAARLRPARASCSPRASATRSRWANRPQTLYGLADSPAALAAWMLDHDAYSLEDIAPAFEGRPVDNLTRDEVLDNITMTWVTNTGVSSGRLYAENTLGFFDVKDVKVPAAVSVFPRELYQAPRSWTEQAYPKLDLLQRGRQGQPLRGLAGARAVRRGAPGGVQVAPRRRS